MLQSSSKDVHKNCCQYDQDDRHISSVLIHKSKRNPDAEPAALEPEPAVRGISSPILYTVTYGINGTCTQWSSGAGPEP